MLVVRNSFPRTARASVPCNTHLARKYPGKLLTEVDSTIGSLRLLPRRIIISLEVASIKQWRGAILKTTRAATSPGGPLLKPGPLVLAQLVTTRRTVSVRQTLAGTWLLVAGKEYFFIYCACVPYLSAYSNQ